MLRLRKQQLRDVRLHLSPLELLHALIELRVGERGLLFLLIFTPVLLLRNVLRLVELLIFLGEIRRSHTGDIIVR